MQLTPALALDYLKLLTHAPADELPAVDAPRLIHQRSEDGEHCVIGLRHGTFWWSVFDDLAFATEVMALEQGRLFSWTQFVNGQEVASGAYINMGQ
jgi:hypothetical protein